MLFHATPLLDVRLIELDKKCDARGHFARAFCEQEFAEAGLETRFTQMNTTFSSRKGTLRGMHYVLPPAAEVKVVRCTRGAVWDCIIDLREGSPTAGRWHGVELNSENRLALYVPRGFAHGLITLKDNTELIYLVSDKYVPQLERGVRWDDPRFAIDWPLQPAEISAKDAAWPNFDPEYHGSALLRNLK